MSTKAYKCPICGDVIYTSHDHGPPCDECGCGMKPDTSEARRVLFDKSQPKEARMAAMNVLQPKPAEAREPVRVTELPRDDETEDEYLIRRLSTLLAEIAVIVNGPEPALTSWGYADLPDLVRKLKDRVPPTRNVPDGATFEDYRDKLAVGELTPLDQMGFDNLLHDRLEATTTDAARVRDAWLPIESAPEGEPVHVYTPDCGDGERWSIDVRVDGVWYEHEEAREHFMLVGGPGACGPDVVCTGPGPDAPYTHWRPLTRPEAIDAALAAVEGEG